MKKENMNHLSKVGDIVQEMNEIKKMQKSVDSYWTISTSTCGEFLSIICC